MNLGFGVSSASTVKTSMLLCCPLVTNSMYYSYWAWSGTSLHSFNSYGGLPNACYCSGHWSFSSKKEIQYFCPRGTYVLEETRQWTHYLKHEDYQFSSVQSLSRIRLFVTPWIAARQASLSITISQSSLKFTSIESVMPSSHLILCRPLLLLPPIPPSIRVFSSESTLHEVAKVHFNTRKKICLNKKMGRRLESIHRRSR